MLQGNQYQGEPTCAGGGRGNGRQLTDNEDEDHCPQWSPDGLRLSFYPERDEDREIYVIKADGSEQTRLTNSSSIVSSLPRIYSSHRVPHQPSIRAIVSNTAAARAAAVRTWFHRVHSTR